jgi:biopolymer transport protein ExbD
MSAFNNESNSSQDVELNLAPIIDCFTVLVTFLLATSTFLSIGTLDAGIAASSENVIEKNTEPVVLVTINLDKNQNYKLKISGKIEQQNIFQNKEELITKLKEIKNKFPKTENLNLSADNEVPYKKIIEAMEDLKKVYPSIVLSGF